MEADGLRVLVESETVLCRAYRFGHSDDKGRGCSVAWVIDYKPPCSESDVKDVHGPGRDVWLVEEPGNKSLGGLVDVVGEGALPVFPASAFVVEWEAVHDVGPEEVGELLDDALGEDAQAGL